MKLLYKPFGIIAGIVGARAGKQAFAAIWSRLSTEPKPAPGEPDVSLTRVVTAAALEAATLAAVSAAVKVLSARIFHHIIGAWPDKPTAA
jgi:hypothetical protein